MTRNPFFQKLADLPAEIPIFPLSGAVVMPGVQLPLNIFEPRYLNMVFDALAGDHLIGMIQPTTETMLDSTPELHRTGCAGRITSYSETTDGRIVMVLTGVCRFDITAEVESRGGYRRVAVSWERFPSDYDADAGPIEDRSGFLAALRAYAGRHGVEIPWDDAEKLADPDLVNLLCAHLPLGSDDKQALIESIGTTERARLMRGLMEISAASGIQAAEQRH